MQGVVIAAGSQIIIQYHFLMSLARSGSQWPGGPGERQEEAAWQTDLINARFWNSNSSMLMYNCNHSWTLDPMRAKTGHDDDDTALLSHEFPPDHPPRAHVSSTTSGNPVWAVFTTMWWYLRRFHVYPTLTWAIKVVNFHMFRLFSLSWTRFDTMVLAEYCWSDDMVMRVSLSHTTRDQTLMSATDRVTWDHLQVSTSSQFLPVILHFMIWYTSLYIIHFSHEWSFMCPHSQESCNHKYFAPGLGEMDPC